MLTITQAMEDVRRMLVDAGIEPVTTDARNVRSPCVLIEPPKLSADTATMCGQRGYTFRLIVVGMPGAWAELDPLAELLNRILWVLEEQGPGWESAEPIGYVPLADTGHAEPVQSYRITTEELY